MTAHPLNPLASGCPPEWASAWGEDRYGVWAAFAVGEVEHPMRWIPAGTFRMGSPDDEPGRAGWEGPRHQVTISEGFWLGETPCTQAVWTAVMGDNPSHFVDPERPVEQVSADDVDGFIARLGTIVPNLAPRLPSEAEWEYACRAGTETATYAGPIELLGERNAPVLDAIAWYGGNSGVDYDLEAAHDSSDWKEKQYAHTRAGTRRVRGKHPNPWGLYDMLGNVWEWCLDGAEGFRPDPYPSEPRIDPVGDRERPRRVYRGGSWYYHARLVRAADRDAFPREYRDDSLGFRFARGRAPGGGSSEPAEPA